MQTYEPKYSAKTICGNFSDLKQMPNESMNDFACRVQVAYDRLVDNKPDTMATVRGVRARDAVAFRYTALDPTARSTGTRSVGTLLPVPGVRSHPTTATLTGSSAVYQTWRHSVQRRCRITRSLSLPLVSVARITPQAHRGQFTASLTC